MLSHHCFPFNNYNPTVRSKYPSASTVGSPTPYFSYAYNKKPQEGGEKKRKEQNRTQQKKMDLSVCFGCYLVPLEDREAPSYGDLRFAVTMEKAYIFQTILSIKSWN